MIFECRRLKGKIDELIGRSRTIITEDFLSVLPPDSKLYQAYFMGKNENSTVENVTSELLGIFLLLTDTELTKLMEISKALLEKANAKD